MESRVKLLGHPLHPMLIPFPIGLLTTAAIFDVIGLLTRDGQWHTAAFWMIAAGVLAGIAAGAAGSIDFAKLPGDTRAKAVAGMHAGGNVVAMVIFALAWFLRREEPADPGILPILLAVVGAGLLAVTGWLGGELVDRMAVGVDEGAHLDSPNSLSGRPAAEGSGARTGVGETSRL